MGNLEKRATASTSRLLTAVLKLCQKVANESAVSWDLAASEVPANKRTRTKVVIFFIVIQSAR